LFYLLEKMTDIKSSFFFHLRSREGRREIWNIMRDHKYDFSGEIADDVYNLNRDKCKKDIKNEITSDRINSEIEKIADERLKTFKIECDATVVNSLGDLVRADTASKFHQSYENFLANRKKYVIKEHEEWKIERERKISNLQNLSILNTTVIVGAACYFLYNSKK